MQQFTKYMPYLMLIFLAFSCNTADKKKKTDEGDKTAVQKEQQYSVETSEVSIKWTAYKFTDKLGVSGAFDQFALNLKNNSGSAETLLEGATITIATASVNSGNEIRDPKLRGSFFKVFNTDAIRGQILDAEQGEGALNLEMNSISNAVEYTYTIKNDTMFLNTHLNVMQWHGEAALKALNKECYDLHTGLDGISKLWPDVDVVVRFPLHKVSFSE